MYERGRGNPPFLLRVCELWNFCQTSELACPGCSILLAGMVDWCSMRPCSRTMNGRLVVSEEKDLLLVNEQLRRSNRRWKALALAACATLILTAFFSVVGATRARIQAEAAMRAERDARARAEVAVVA